MKLIPIIFAFFLLLSCQEEEKIPELVLSETEFTAALTEFVKAEAIVRLGYNRTDSIVLNDSVYVSALAKRNISKIEFDSSFSYYSGKPKKFEKIYEKVITNLSAESADLNTKKEK